MPSNSPAIRVEALLIQSARPEFLAGFYHQGFQLPEPVRAGEDHLGMNVANTYLGFDRAPDAADGAARACIWFRIADVHTVFARLVELGATVDYAPTDTKSPGEILAMVYDPDGNPIGLIAPADSNRI